jgi:excisionase family DNA binding protein
MSGRVMTDTLMTVAEVCAYLQVSRSTWAKWRARGVTPPVVRLRNGSLRVRRTALEVWLDDLEEGVAA